MKNVKLIYIFALVVLILAPNVEAKKPKRYQDVPIPTLDWKLPQHQEYRLPNGIEGLLVEDHEVAMVDFYFKFNAPPDPSDKVGLGEITAWALRQGGSVNIPGDSLNDIIEFTASGVYIWTDDEAISIWGNCLSEHLPTILSLVRELIDLPAYPQAKIDLKRGTMLEEIRRKNDQPQWVASREFYKLMYPNHPWGWETSENSLSTISRDDLLTYHNLVFRADGCVIGFSGDLTLDRALELSRQTFGHLTQSEEEIAGLPSLPPPPAPGVHYGHKEVNQAYIYIGHRSIRYDDPRRIASEIMNYILGGGGFQSILMKRIRVDAGLTYAVGSRFTTPVEGEGVFRAGASTRLDQSGRTLELLRKTIIEYAANGPMLEEFNKARDAFVNSYVWEYDSSIKILGRLVYLKWRHLPLDTPQLDLAAYQKLTRDDVKRAAQELLHPDDMLIVVVGDKSKMDRPLEDFGAVQEINLSQP
ncbi:MAG: insulinase family protein [Calditrichaeota bacterium]|nr:insulinase family protein [Calditrichota bacterium]